MRWFRQPAAAPEPVVTDITAGDVYPQPACVRRASAPPPLRIAMTAEEAALTLALVVMLPAGSDLQRRLARLRTELEGRTRAIPAPLPAAAPPSAPPLSAPVPPAGLDRPAPEQRAA